MKYLSKYIFLLLCSLGLGYCLSPIEAKSKSPPADSLSFHLILEEAKLESALLQYNFQQQQMAMLAEKEALSLMLGQVKTLDDQLYIEVLESLLELQQEEAVNQVAVEVEMLKMRYSKGIDLIKLLYEKTLGLDHHFSGMQTFQNIDLLSNPNTYPEFRQTQSMIEKRTDKRFAFQMPAIFDTNPFLTATISVVSALLGSGKSEEKEADFSKISCILDFTVRMNSDLNVVRHETEFLNTANQNLKQECERLFDEYTKVLGYHVPLDKCRNNDDWESLRALLDEYIKTMEDLLKQNNGQSEQFNKMEVDLVFSTQRVAEFISKYSNFISQGMQYYQKFDNIVSSYENEDICQTQLPRQFSELKFDIKTTIEKFNNTYNLPEIQGSRLKHLLFGSVDW